MKIRSITSFYDPRAHTAGADLQHLADFSDQLKLRISQELMPVQSTRLATIPYPLFLDAHSPEQTLQTVLQMEKSARDMGWQYLSLGPALPDHLEFTSLIPHLLAAAPSVFCCTVMADEQFIYPAAIRRSAKLIRKISTLSPDGFTNLRFAALANVPSYAPFLPAAYAQPGEPPAFSIAVECADVVVETFSNAQDLAAARQALLDRLEDAANRVMAIIHQLDPDSHIQFKGFDFSPAPYPQDWCSLAASVEALGLEHIGGIGSLAAVAVVADTLDRGNWPRAGFNGMMLPVLEDSRLSRRAGEGFLTVQDLLLYSTVCGTGLDTIPLPGDVTQSDLESVLADVAALAVRLGKPLTARLMPMPGKQSGDLTNFEFEYFSNTRVMSCTGQQLRTPLFGEAPIPLQPRKIRN